MTTEYDVRRFAVGDWECRIWCRKSLFGVDSADAARAAAEGLAFHVEESFEEPNYRDEGYAESCGRLADLILKHVRRVIRAEVYVDGDGVAAIADEDRE